MGAFQDYLDLRMAVAEMVGRNDISDVMPRMVKLAESYLNRELRIRDMETPAVLTFANGVAPLPADYLEMKYVFGGDGTPMQGTTARVVAYDRNAQNGYSIENDGVHIYSLNGVTRNCIYYASLPTLTASPTTSNWLLQDAENLYLYAVSYEVAKWMKDVDLASKLAGLRDLEMVELKRMDNKARFGNAVIRPVGALNP